MEGVEVPQHAYLMAPRIPLVRGREPLASAIVERDGEAPTRVLFGRQSTTTSAASAATTSCAPNDDSGLCQKPVGSSSTTLPIILGVAIPLGLAIIVLVFLHRRSVRKVKQEDAMDPHKSLDFGLGEGGKLSKGNRKSLRGEKDPRRNRQLSMDMNLSSPYLLPPGLQGSRESLHSLARTLHQNEDPYRPVAHYVGSDAGSLRSMQKGREGSVRSGSSGGGESGYRTRPLPSPGLPPPRQHPMPSSPLPPEPVHRKPAPQERGVSTTPSPPQTSFLLDPFPDPHEPTLPHLESLPYPEDTRDMPGQAVSPPPVIQEPPPVAQQIPRKGLPSGPKDRMVKPPSPPPAPEPEQWNNAPHSDHFEPQDPSANGLGLLNSHSPPQSTVHMSPPSSNSYLSDPQQQRFSPPMSAPIIEEPREYYDNEYPPMHQQQQHGDDYEDRGRSFFRESMNMNYHQEAMPNSLGIPQQDKKRLSVGFRPLPPDEIMESDDPEVRANRIRSFYKEYFDDSREPPPPLPSGPHYGGHNFGGGQQYAGGQQYGGEQHYGDEQQYGGGGYYEDYDANYSGEAAYFDPETNAFVMPYAQPVARRAMTPPPSGSRFPGPRGPRNFHGSIGGMSLPGGRGPPRPGSSASNRVPRSGSAMSGRVGGGPRKPMPPPSALITLPTPSKLRDDSFALLGSIDFAPPESYADRQAGRSQSPVGERRPYQLKVPISSPLVNAFDELPALPSPHLLRKSSTFTALDFAPPRKFDSSDARSDAGSIRSNRSGMSAAQLGAIRGGAGRVSRLPGDQIFTAAQTSQKLKPSWNMRD